MMNRRTFGQIIAAAFASVFCKFPAFGQGGVYTANPSRHVMHGLVAAEWAYKDQAVSLPELTVGPWTNTLSEPDALPPAAQRIKEFLEQCGGKVHRIDMNGRKVYEGGQHDTRLRAAGCEGCAPFQPSLTPVGLDAAILDDITEPSNDRVRDATRRFFNGE
jgi:hypothetical protein